VTGGGTGLRRLRERLEALYGPRASLATTSAPGAGFTAVVTLPLEIEREA
jgi:sensor histidine kinase YesM